MINIVSASSLERSVKSIFIIAIILLFRQILNVKSIKRANMILWSILFVYLISPYSILIKIEDFNQYRALKYILEPLMIVSGHIREFLKDIGTYLSKNNTYFIASLFLIYVLVRIVKMNKALKNSVPLKNDVRVEEACELFKLKRKVDILINNKVKVPITYGFLKPKIIIQSKILEDDELLKFVLVHELTHVKNFDIVFKHIKNFIACMYWYNIFILASLKFIEDDMEILCDKLVIQKLGDTIDNRKEYCMSMLKLIEQNQNVQYSVLNLHPTKERMLLIKKWRTSFIGVCVFALILVLSTLPFIDVYADEGNRVISSEPESNIVLNIDNRVSEITEDEYKNLKLGEIHFNELRSADIDSKESLEGLEHKSYKFNTYSWTETKYDGFTVKMSDMSCNEGIDYIIIILENGREIFNKNYDKADTLTIKAYQNNRYEVIVLNTSLNILKYRVKINSYNK
ncbi:M56 family metallopeptidase [Fenollaria sp.]|uniref:M56 family metallopeptidase n=1 Tax=Fenollaria sp. TaxID=1965292 RepID=UPI002A761E80|nr:M56 family metallopeptidase [Fenollaria sp.]MDY3105674.1 M56 family metallopeptidase [Fenollaria sp.]